MVKKIKSISIILTLILIATQIFYPRTVVKATENDINYDNAIESSMKWLNSVQSDDGFWANNSIINDTCDAIELFQGIDEEKDVTTAISWLEKKGYRDSNDKLARYLRVSTNEELYHELLSAQNEDGGFGLVKGYSSNIVDSTIVLQTLVNTKDIYQDQVIKLINYFIDNQNEDGSFGFNGKSDIAMTAIIAKAIRGYLDSNFLKSQLTDNLLFNVDKYFEKINYEDFSEKSFENSILVYSYISDKSSILETQDIVKKLVDVQDSNGSFYGNIHKTILATKLINDIKNKEKIKTEITNLDLSLNMNSIYVNNKTGIKGTANISYYSNYNKKYVLQTKVYDGENVISSSENDINIDRSKTEITVDAIEFIANESIAKDLIIKSGLYDEKGELVKETQAVLSVKDKYADTDVLLIQSVLPWSTNSNEIVLNSLGVSYDKVLAEEVRNKDLLKYRVVLVANDQTNPVYRTIGSLKTELESFVKNGGTLVYGVCDGGWSNGNSDKYIPGDIKIVQKYIDNNYIVDKTHKIVTAEYSDKVPLVDADLYNNHASHIYFDKNSLPENTNIILNGGEDYPTLIEYNIGKGTVIASGLTWEHSYHGYISGSNFGKKALDDLFLYALNITYTNIEDEEPGTVEATITTDKDEYNENEDMKIDVSAELTSYKRLVKGKVDIIDENGKVIDTIDDKYEKLLTVGIPDKKSYVWNTKNCYSGKYKIRASYYDGDELISQSEKEFSVLPNGEIKNTVSTDKKSYKVNEDATITTKIKNTSTNCIEKDLKLSTKVIDENSNIVFSEDKDIDEILSSNEKNESITWNIGDIIPGKYTVISTVLRNDELIIESQCDIEIVSSKTDYSGILGKLTLSKEVLKYNESLDFKATISNVGNCDLVDLKQKVEIINTKSNDIIYTRDIISSLAKGDIKENSYTFNEGKLESGTYLVTYKLIKNDGTEVELDHKTFKVEYIEDDFEKENDLWNYMGTAHRSDDGYAVLTENKNHENGAMWLKQGISMPFVTTFKYKAGAGTGADGFVFMFAKKADELGNEGREMGFA